VERTGVRHSHDIIADILSACAILRQAAVTDFNLDQVAGQLARVRSPIGLATPTMRSIARSPLILALAEPEVGHLYRDLAAIDEALQRAGAPEELWHLAEALPVKGGLLLLQNKSNAAAAENDFLRSLDLARRQGALSWELRAATSLACCATGTASVRRAICWRRFMSGLPKDLAPPNCEKQSGLSTRCRKSLDLCSMVVDLS
jgi:hypothetical protein